jgi:hypothetical protein
MKRLPRMTVCIAALVLGCGSKASPRRTPDAAIDEELEDAAAPPPQRDAAMTPATPDAEDVVDAQPTDVALTFPRHPSCTMPPPPVMNGNFELPGAGVPGWQVETTGAATAQIDPISGFAGTGALSIRVPDDASGSGVFVHQSLTLQPFTAYNFRARIATGNMHPRGDGPFLFTVTIRNGARTFTVGPRKQDRTDLDYGSYASDFGTGPDGRVELELRSAGAGQYLVDQVLVTCSDRAQRYGDDKLALTIYDSDVQSATPPNIDKVIATAKQALDAYADLTGNTDPTSMRASAFPTVAAVADAQGNPALWFGGVTAPLWSTPGYLPSSLAGGLARNFDRPAWLFDNDLSLLTVYYAAETLNLTFADDTARGKNARKIWEQYYTYYWKAGGCADPTGLAYKNVLIRDQIGWEPFKKTFRYFAGLTGADLPATRGEKMKRFYDKLAEFSGMDVWAVFTPTERMLMDARYNAPVLPDPKPLATLPVTTLTVPLTAVQWESATARDRPARLRQPNDCPLATAAGPADNALYAYPFSQYVYRLGKRWKRLAASYSLYAGQTGSVVFVVRGDGRELLRSTLVRDAMPRTLDLDVSTVDRLELIVTDGGDGNSSDGAVWVNPRLSR